MRLCSRPAAVFPLFVLAVGLACVAVCAVALVRVAVRVGSLVCDALGVGVTAIMFLVACTVV